MNVFYLVLAAFAFSSVSLPIAAHADWQSELKIKTAHSGESSPLSGKAYGKSGAFRIDMTTPQGPMSVITDFNKHKTFNLIHGPKIVMEGDLNRMGVQIPNCITTDIDNCYLKSGFKKTGAESVNGHPCSIFEKDQTTPVGNQHIKLWRPTDLKEVPFVRSVNRGEDGDGATLDLTEVKIVSSLGASLFSPPNDYRTLQMPKGFGGH